MTNLYRYMKISVSYMTSILGFDSAQDCTDYITEFGVIFTDHGASMDCKVSQITDASQKFKKLEVDSGVTHGAF